MTYNSLVYCVFFRSESMNIYRGKQFLCLWFIASSYSIDYWNKNSTGSFFPFTAYIDISSQTIFPLFCFSFIVRQILKTVVLWANTKSCGIVVSARRVFLLCSTFSPRTLSQPLPPSPLPSHLLHLPPPHAFDRLLCYRWSLYCINFSISPHYVQLLHRAFR